MNPQLPRNARRLALTAFVAASLAVAGTAQSGLALKNGDRVVFYGDSITEQQLYTTYVEAILAGRYPQLDVSFTKSGVGGDQVTGGWMGGINDRVARDVKPYKATVLTIMLGMNDGHYTAYDPKIAEAFESGYVHMLALLRGAAPNARITLIRTSPFDDYTRKESDAKYNDALQKYGERVEAPAKQNNMGYVDFNAPLVEALRKASMNQDKVAQEIIPDRIHPGAGGHLLMAAELLKAWGVKPVVSALDLDAAGKKVVAFDNTKATGFNGMSWTQTDASLPLPVDTSDAAMMLAVRSSDVAEKLDVQFLRVKGLSEGKYSLSIDGKQVGEFDNAKLSRGINLALLDTPMRRQSMKVLDLVRLRSRLHNVRWREFQYYFNDTKGVSGVYAAIDKFDAEMRQQIRQASTAKPHKYELKLVPAL